METCKNANYSVSVGILWLLLLPLILSCDLNSPSEDITGLKEIRFTHELISDELEYPWQLSFTDQSKIFITEVKGLIRVIEDDKLLPEPWFDLRPYMEDEGLFFPLYQSPGRQRSGLQGIAVDPDFENNGFIYVGFAYHTDEHSYDYNRLLRLKENPETGKGELDRVLLDKVPGFDLHQAGQLKFGPDQKLYWSTADRFEPESAQDLSDLSGKILRLNADGSIPSDNPFPGSFVYSYGHRNPQGFSWSPEEDIFIATEHGPSGDQGCCRDELNKIEAGMNYGWPIIAGSQSEDGLQSPILQSGDEPEDPQYNIDSTWAPSGATFVHSGPWKGAFIFAGLRSKTLYQVTFDKDYNPENLVTLIDNQEQGYFRARSVDQAPDGSIYMITSNMDRTYNPQLGRTDYLVKINVFYVEE